MSYQDPRQAQVQQPPLTEEEMQASGLDGYAADFVTGPEPLLRFLDQTAGFRRKVGKLRALLTLGRHPPRRTRNQ